MEFSGIVPFLTFVISNVWKMAGSDAMMSRSVTFPDVFITVKSSVLIWRRKIKTINLQS